MLYMPCADIRHQSRHLRGGIISNQRKISRNAINKTKSWRLSGDDAAPYENEGDVVS